MASTEIKQDDWKVGAIRFAPITIEPVNFTLPDQEERILEITHGVSIGKKFKVKVNVEVEIDEKV